MLVTLRNQSQPISLVDLHQVKKIYAKEYRPIFSGISKIIRTSFKQTAFYSFFLIATKDPA